MGMSIYQSWEHKFPATVDDSGAGKDVFFDILVAADKYNLIFPNSYSVLDGERFIHCDDFAAPQNQVCRAWSAARQKCGHTNEYAKIEPFFSFHDMLPPFKAMIASSMSQGKIYLWAKKFKREKDFSLYLTSFSSLVYFEFAFFMTPRVREKKDV
jgi:hypothetical protein